MDDNGGHRWIMRAPTVWVDIAPLALDKPGAVLDHPNAKLWSLALESRGVKHRLRTRTQEQGGGYAVEAPESSVDVAVGEIRQLLRENDPAGQRVFLPDLRQAARGESTIIAMVLMLLFHWAVNRAYPSRGVFPDSWLEAGSAKANLMLGGEWWRAVTALSLHADGAHVLGNALVGGAFLFLATRRLGPGLAWSLTLAAGALGNLVNAWVMGPTHNAIGFSTASFGAAGILAGMAPFGGIGGRLGAAAAERIGRLGGFVRNWLLPAGCGLGLLAMLGAGPGTDLGAHLFGLLAGMVLGAGAGWFAMRTGVPNRGGDAVLAIAAMATVVMCWALAWNAA